MNKDVPATPADQRHGSVVSVVLRDKTRLWVLLLSPALGVLVGILNFLAATNRLKFQDYFFDIVDAPIRRWLAPDWSEIGPSAWPYMQHQALSVEQVMICYWAVIGLFLALLFCLVRTGIVRDIVRDPFCKYVLFFGTCAGAFIGILSFLAASIEWVDLDQFFDLLNQPAYMVMRTLNVRYGILNFLPPGPRTEFICWHGAGVVYWAIIGLSAATLVCVVRILKKRRARTCVAEE